MTTESNRRIVERFTSEFLTMDDPAEAARLAEAWIDLVRRRCGHPSIRRRITRSGGPAPSSHQSRYCWSSRWSRRCPNTRILE
jgi:hypothetical protein